jgi:hypothetical protein
MVSKNVAINIGILIYLQMLMFSEYKKSRVLPLLEVLLMFLILEASSLLKHLLM